MANALYPKYLEYALSLTLNGGSSVGADIKACLVSSAYTYNSAHDFLDDLAGIQETSANLGSKTIVNGTFDAADITFTATAGDPATALVLYVDSGVAGTSRLIAYLDTIPGFPVTLGGDVTITWNASGIFTLNPA